MISGKLALGGLSLEFGNQEKRFQELSTEVARLSAEEEGLFEEEREIIEELARIYLPELSREAVLDGPRALATQMRGALEKHVAYHEELVRDLTLLPARIAEAVGGVVDAEQDEASTAASLESVRRAVEQDLGVHPVHANQVEEHRAVMERRSVLKSRRSRLQTTANVERLKYEEDKSFSYLLNRQFGQPEYRGRFVARWMDAWLARRIDFATLNRNYRVLRTGPHAIQAEIRRLTARATELEAEIDAREAESGTRRGLLAALEANAAAQRRLVDARDALEETRRRHDEMSAELRAVEANKGRPHEDALSIHREYIEGRSVQDLIHHATSTPDPADDALVYRLQRLRQKMEAVGSALKDRRVKLESAAQSTTSLADVARHAAAHFTSRRSFFPEEFRLEKLVESILEGEAGTDEALDLISNAHVKGPLLTASPRSELDGWFAELSSVFDPELGAVSMKYQRDADVESEVIVQDGTGRVLHRRVTKRRGWGGPADGGT